MKGALRSDVVPSLIQGVSQQAIHSRAKSSAEAQVNCLNSVLDGVVSRFGSSVLGVTSTKFSKPFDHEIKRSEAEHYVVFIENGDLEIYNLADGTKATVTGDISSYLANGKDGYLAYDAVTVEDNTFIVNRDKLVAMSASVSPTRANNAMAHFRSGNYKTTYAMTVTVGGTPHTISYETPDNSVEVNAKYIATNQLAKSFEDEINNVLIPNLDAAGHTGFSVTRDGSVLTIHGAANSFSISTEDGIGGKAFISFSDHVRKFSDLPKGGLDGYEVRVSGDSKSADDDYYLKYEGDSNSGAWRERLAPGTITSLDAATMPHRLINTGLNTFTVSPAPWGERLAGDGTLNAVDPGFVGRKVLDINYISGRLALSTEATTSLSKAKNSFVFFPDTVQTILASAPIDFEISNGKVTITSRTIVVSEKLQLWADRVQVILDSGNDRMQEDTIDPKPITSFKFDGMVAPLAVGSDSLIFASGSNKHTLVTQVFLRNSRPFGQIKLNAHCPRYLPGRARLLKADGDYGMLALLTNSETDKVYTYQWHNQGDERVQSAWNEWEFKTPISVPWVTIDEGVMYLMCQWETNCTLERIELDTVGPEPEATFPLRLDHRVVSDPSDYSAVTGKHTFILPFEINSANFHNFRCYQTNNIDDASRRGRELEIVIQPDGVTVDVSSWDVAVEFSLGVIPMSSHRPSELVMKTDRGVVYSERLLVAEVFLGYANTSSFSVNTHFLDRVDRQHYSPRILGDTDYTNLDVPRKTGFMRIPIAEEANKFFIELINDTPLVSQWESLEYSYRITKRQN